MTWSDEAWKEIENIYQKILDSPFVVELGNGSLSKSRFVTYMKQDKLYLNDYARALALIAAHAYTPQDTTVFASFAQTAAEAEQSLHDFYLDFHKDADNVGGIETTKNVTCELYTSFLLRHAAMSPVEIAAAAVLPCFWIYDAVGIHHRARLEEHKIANKNHPYAKWIEMYSSVEFTSGTMQAREFCDRLAANTTPEIRRKMTEVFVKASLMEHMFWNAAWDDQQWP